jgi:glutathione synthase/RimK-type ligase-like ATP-grasp enzyme
VCLDGRIDGRARIALLAERRYLAQRQPLGLVAELERREWTVRLIDPDFTAISLTDDSWLAGVELCVARGRSHALLSWLLAAERRGLQTINRQSAVAGVRDKAAMAVALAGAGIPTPPTMLGSPSQLAAELPADLYPVILKPIHGDNCRGLRVCGSPDEVAGLSPSDRDPLLAQPYLAGDGMDLKLYAVGERIWAIRKPSPLRTGGALGPRSAGSAEATPVELTADLRRLARDCSELFGLELFGVDCLITRAGPVVIEVNDYPNYSGVPEADAALASHVLARLGAASRVDTTWAEVAG